MRRLVGVHIQDGDGLVTGELVAAVVQRLLGLGGLVVELVRLEVGEEGAEVTVRLVEGELLSALCVMGVVHEGDVALLELALRGGRVGIFLLFLHDLAVALHEDLHVHAVLGQLALFLAAPELQLVEGVFLVHEILEGGVGRGVGAQVVAHAVDIALLDGCEGRGLQGVAVQVDVYLLIDKAADVDAGLILLRAYGDLDAVHGIEHHAGCKQHRNGALHSVPKLSCQMSSRSHKSFPLLSLRLFRSCRPAGILKALRNCISVFHRFFTVCA